MSKDNISETDHGYEEGLPDQKEGSFEDYTRDARDEFVKAICDNTWNTAIRTAAENILIAYDQMRDRLSEPSSKEQEGDAVGFAEWANTNYRHYQPGKWRKLKETIGYTTEQLYQLYKKKP